MFSCFLRGVTLLVTYMLRIICYLFDTHGQTRSCSENCISTKLASILIKCIRCGQKRDICFRHLSDLSTAMMLLPHRSTSDWTIDSLSTLPSWLVTYSGWIYVSRNTPGRNSASDRQLPAPCLNPAVPPLWYYIELPIKAYLVAFAPPSSVPSDAKRREEDLNRFLAKLAAPFTCRNHGKGRDYVYILLGFPDHSPIKY